MTVIFILFFFIICDILPYNIFFTGHVFITVHVEVVQIFSDLSSRMKTFDSQRLCVIRRNLQSCQAEIFSPVLHSDNIPNRWSSQAFAHHSTHSTLEASTLHSLHTRFAYQLIARASVEQNSIGHTQIIISQDFKRIAEGLVINFPSSYFRNLGNGPQKSSYLMEIDYSKK
jgi:hypothetical protein